VVLSNQLICVVDGLLLHSPSRRIGRQYKCIMAVYFATEQRLVCLTWTVGGEWS
jgi:hypothetical protein